ncbi:MAG: Na+/H+ antiporter NhaA, partial [Bdellovibrionales bacterium]|nr:Na+/H+ antiporter NhaA [Bdellovibrionales bacterium]
DLGAIVIIALFYSGALSLEALGLAAAMLAVLLVMNIKGVRRISAYLLIGVVLWASVLKSGVHATLAGVLLAFFIPHRRDETGHSPLEQLEHDLHSVVAFGILPLFAFANAGISFRGITTEVFFDPVALGIAAGLFFGKQLGIFSAVWVAVRLGFCRLGPELRWSYIYGASLLCGIGFTMSLFIGSLAFQQGGPDYGVVVRLGIIVGSLVSALAGYVVLHRCLPRAGR